VVCYSDADAIVSFQPYGRKRGHKRGHIRARQLINGDMFGDVIREMRIRGG
jgi:hypothetical protein